MQEGKLIYKRNDERTTKERLILIVPALSACFKFTTNDEETTGDRRVRAMFSRAPFAHTCSRK